MLLDEELVCSQMKRCISAMTCLRDTWHMSTHVHAHQRSTPVRAPTASQELARSESAAVRNNILVALSDLCTQFTAMVDGHLGRLAACIVDRHELVRGCRPVRVPRSSPCPAFVFAVHVSTYSAFGTQPPDRCCYCGKRPSAQAWVLCLACRHSLPKRKPNRLFSSPSVQVRRQALALLANLLMKDYVKARGTLFHRCDCRRVRRRVHCTKRRACRYCMTVSCVEANRVLPAKESAKECRPLTFLSHPNI